MSRDGIHRNLEKSHVPRASGDEPVDKAIADLGDGCAPRQRG